ncbi:MAG: hypothetical protein AAGC65_19885 [Mucilaginibacter sp.]|uniref:hypothetical protein n=1 Tax=Mucilaginibacter sp. TaxID=1882438 RepID=UPI0031AA43A0
MIKWFAYIVLLLIFAPTLLLAGIKNGGTASVYNTTSTSYSHTYKVVLKDTVLAKKQDEKNKIKEVAKPKKQTKPEKVDDSGAPVTTKPKTKRQRRPEGLERPPEIPRRNSN